MTFLVIITVLFFFNLAYRIYNIEKERKSMLRQVEIQFLIGSIYFLKYKHQMNSLLEIIYQKSAENDPQFMEDFDKIKLKTDEKIKEFGDEWINNLKKTIGFETDYKNWEEATKYIDEFISRLQKSEPAQRDDQ
jgi:hypothetical protein